MNCREFEETISDYLDGRLESAVRSRFGAHALQCRHCRALLDDVKHKLTSFERDEEPQTRSELDIALEMIPESQTTLDCEGFEELVTEFLDGYVPASVYHKFAEHSDGCEGCSKILTDVVYAVAACHSVHTYEEYDVPPGLAEKLVEAVPSVSERRTTGRLPALCRNRLAGARRRFGDAVAGIAVSRLAMASGLIIAFLTLLIAGAPDFGLRGVYSRAQEKAGDLYSQGVGIYSQEHEVEARVQQVGSDIAEVWRSLNDARSSSSADDKEEAHPTERR